MFVIKRGLALTVSHLLLSKAQCAPSMGVKQSNHQNVPSATNPTTLKLESAPFQTASKAKMENAKSARKVLTIATASAFLLHLNSYLARETN